jgi:hypothetical protein
VQQPSEIVLYIRGINPIFAFFASGNFRQPRGGRYGPPQGRKLFCFPDRVACDLASRNHLTASSVFLATVDRKVQNYLGASVVWVVIPAWRDSKHPVWKKLSCVEKKRQSIEASAASC